MFSVASSGFPCFLLLIFYVLCKRFSSPPCIGLAIVALFIKWGESLFRDHHHKHLPYEHLSLNRTTEMAPHLKQYPAFMRHQNIKLVF
jgi:hypothetical protein